MHFHASFVIDDRNYHPKFTIVNKSIESFVYIAWPFKKSIISYGNTGIFIDIKKAFDMVDHSIILDKLYNDGFRGVSHGWLKYYF